MRLSRSIRVIGTMAMLLVLATAAYAFTAQNTVPASDAGLGSGDINGYTVSNITYTFDGDLVDTVTFDLDKSASTVKAQLLDQDPPAATPGATGQVDCADQGGNTWQCDFSGENASAEHVDSLSVLASQ